MIESIEKKYGGILVPLNELQSFIDWYTRYSGYHSAWDNKRYEFCLEALEYTAKAGIKQTL